VRGARTLLLLASVPLLLVAPPASAQLDRAVLVYLVDVGYEEAIEDPALRAIGARGGIGLLTETEASGNVIADLRAAGGPQEVMVSKIGSANVGERLEQLRFFQEQPLPSPTSFPIDDQARLLVLVFDPEAPAGSSPLVMGSGNMKQLRGTSGAVRGLTSATTGRPGLVSNADLLPTVLEFLGRPIPADVPGNPIRVEGAEPTELHDLYAGYRRVVTPVGLAILGLALGALAVGMAILLGAWSPSGAVGRGLAILAIFAVSLHVAMLPGSWLPTYSWPLVLETLGLTAVGLTVVVVWSAEGLRYPHRAAVVVAGAGALLVLVDWLLGWRSLLTPLLGGSALEGGRFYGLGNSYAGLLLAGAVLLAALLRPWDGVAVLAGAALFAGSPWTGADLGGGVTLFVAAAIWWALAVRGRVRLLEVVVVVGTAVLGAVVLVALHGLVAEPSHVTRAVQGAGGVAGVAGTFWDRLRLNLEVTARTPVVWPALAGVVVATVAAWRRWSGIALAFRGQPSWRPAVLTLGLSAVAGYLLNDTYGLTAVAFIYLMLALVYPATLEKMFGRNGKKS